MTTRTHVARLVALALLALTWATVPAAHAEDQPFGPRDFTVSSSTTQAGGHPDVTTSFGLNTIDADPAVDPMAPDISTDPPVGDPAHVPHYAYPSEGLRDVRLALPAGLVGDPTHIPQCPMSTFGQGAFGPPCPEESQVGVVRLKMDLGFGGAVQDMSFPVYNVAPPADQPAVFGFAVLAPNVPIGFQVRTAGDAGLTAVLSGINQAARIYGQSLTLWGVPADAAHDAQRGTCLTTNTTDDGDPSTPLPDTRCPVTTPRVPLLRNPTSCGDALPMTLDVASWSHPDRDVQATATATAVTGCAAVPFTPSVTAAPDGGSADAPTGLDVSVGIDQNRDPDGLGASDLRRAVVTLPEGYAISPSAADGLQACDAAGVGIGAAGAASCPDASKIGSVSIDTPLLTKPLTGPIYLGPSPSPGRYELFLVAEGSGIRLKLPGVIDADRDSGQITATFDDTPQQPFSRLSLHFDGGPRAVLATPATCGTSTARATLTPWSGTAPVALDVPVGLGGGECPAAAGFAPTLSAGLENPAAGTDSPFTLTVARGDRSQPLGALSSVTLPAGLTAHVGSVPRCGAADAAAGTCPTASRVGRVVVAAGAGPHPFGLSGTAYLTGGYKGAPFGLSLVVPALAGPYNLGTVVIRSAIDVATDARITVRTDPLPQVLAGIPLRLRTVGLVLDRPGFMAAPTSCAPSAVQATVTSAAGTTSALAGRFAMSGCSRLRFAPRMALTAKPSSRTQGAGLHVALTMPAAAGQANLKSVALTLPKEIQIKLKSLGTACTKAQLAALACPAASKIGGASARTPLLGQTLKGAVYLAVGDTTLPKLVAILQGDGVTIPLAGATTFTKGGRLVSTFAAIPDVPITTFDLDLPHTRRSILQTARLPCRGAGASVAFTAQNGAVLRRTVPVGARCAGYRRGHGHS
jgi:hypothetical protein